jgi:predicted nucleotidyltransferase component of viral defense system
LLPLVADETAFALKGGTAINFFVRDMPRLSVDIDLTYLPVADRAASLTGISEGLARIKARAEERLPATRLTLVPQGDDLEVKMHCQRGRARVKIEVNPLQRGSLWPVRQLACTNAVQEVFESFVEMPVVSHADLFGGKVSAALDRQHPRDVFDVRHLLDTEGFGGDVRAGDPDWSLSPVAGAERLPAPRWKLLTIQKLRSENLAKHAGGLRTLAQVLGMPAP